MTKNEFYKEAKELFSLEMKLMLENSNLKKAEKLPNNTIEINKISENIKNLNSKIKEKEVEVEKADSKLYRDLFSFDKDEVIQNISKKSLKKYLKHARKKELAKDSAMYHIGDNNFTRSYVDMEDCIDVAKKIELSKTENSQSCEENEHIDASEIVKSYTNYIKKTKKSKFFLFNFFNIIKKRRQKKEYFENIERFNESGKTHSTECKNEDKDHSDEIVLENKSTTNNFKSFHFKSGTIPVVSFYFNNKNLTYVNVCRPSFFSGIDFSGKRWFKKTDSEYAAIIEKAKSIDSVLYQEMTTYENS